MKKNITLTMLLIILLSPSAMLMANPAVRVIFFSPSDQPVPNKQDVNKVAGIAKNIQDFYRDQQIRNGFDAKTFALEGNATSLDIHIVRGHQNTVHYATGERWNTILQETAGAKSKINLIFVEGLEILSVTRHALMSRSCLGTCQNHDFTYDAVVPLENEGVIPAAAHELGHAFGLQHNRDNQALMVAVRQIPVGQNPPLASMHLKKYESRWLDRHKFFNDDNSPHDPPTVRKIHLTEWVDRDKIDMRLRIDISSNSELHQAKILRDTDDVVIDSEALMGRTDNAYFHLSSLFLPDSDTYSLQIIDRRGNQRYVDRIRIEVPEIISSPIILREEKPKEVSSVVVVNWATIKNK